MIISISARNDGCENIYIYRNGYYELYVEEFNDDVFFTIYIPKEGSMWNTEESNMFDLYIDKFYAYGEKPLYREDISKNIRFNFIALSPRYDDNAIGDIKQIDKEIKGLQIAKRSIIEFTDFINSWNPSNI